MKKQLNLLKYRLAKLFKNHQAFVVIVVVLMVLMAAMLRINSLSNIPLDQGYLDKKSSELKSVQFNQDAISQIQDLNDSNVDDPGTQLPSNRQNPFNE